MGNLQYRSTVWICQHICADSAFFQDVCPTIPLFKTMMRRNASWGRYAVYITWLHRHFPSQGYIVFRYLKRHHTAWTYSFPYLVWQYLLYHGSKIIHGLCLSFTTRLSGRNCKICQSPQDTPKESETTTGIASLLYTA